MPKGKDDGRKEVRQQSKQTWEDREKELTEKAEAALKRPSKGRKPGVEAPDTIECPSCGAKNRMKNRVCFHCSAILKNPRMLEKQFKLELTNLKELLSHPDPEGDESIED